MDNLLMLFDEESQVRYKTVLENIKNASDSFYDSYNSLLEHFLRIICPKKIKGSISSIIKDKTNKKYLLETMKLNSKVYNKILDYALKMNAHKHKKQKFVDIDVVINYMKIFYDVVFAYARFVKYTIPSFDEKYFIDLYNQYEDDKNDVKSIKDKVDYLLQKKEVEERRNVIANARLEALHCGNYSYESTLSNKFFERDKTIIIALMLSCFVLFLIGLFFITDKNLALGYFIMTLPFSIFYLVRFIQFLKCKKMEEATRYGESKYLIIKISEDGLPINTGMFKISQHIINFFAGFLILGVCTEEVNFFMIGLFVLFIITCIFFIIHKQTFKILVMHSRYGDMYYSFQDGIFVDKEEDGTFK